MILAEEEAGRASWDGRLPSPWAWRPALPPLAKQAVERPPAHRLGSRKAGRMVSVAAQAPGAWWRRVG